MQKQELFAFAAAQEGAAIDFPFEGDFETAVFRHADTRKWFAIWLSVPRRHFAACEEAAREARAGAGAEDAAGGKREAEREAGAEFCCNVKCPPDLILLLAGRERGVYPAYHMNRRHWVTLRLGECADETVRQLVRLSFTLTARQTKKR